MNDAISDSGSEFFESAEEDLSADDDKGNYEKPKKNKRVTNNEEVEKPAVNDKEDKLGDSTTLKITEKKCDSTTYRKRPEKPKQLLKRPSRTPNPSRGLRNDSIFKTDIIAPDNLFQDITTNISKNLNKSLNTIQQTSSEVKNLILNSFPAAGFSEKDAFSYDDDNNNNGRLVTPPAEGANSGKIPFPVLSDDLKNVALESNAKNIELETSQPKFNEGDSSKSNKCDVSISDTSKTHSQKDDIEGNILSIVKPINLENTPADISKDSQNDFSNNNKSKSDCEKFNKGTKNKKNKREKNNAEIKSARKNKNPINSGKPNQDALQPVLNDKQCSLNQPEFKKIDKPSNLIDEICADKADKIEELKHVSSVSKKDSKSVSSFSDSKIKSPDILLTDSEDFFSIDSGYTLCEQLSVNSEIEVDNNKENMQCENKENKITELKDPVKNWTDETSDTNIEKLMKLSDIDKDKPLPRELTKMVENINKEVDKSIKKESETIHSQLNSNSNAKLKNSSVEKRKDSNGWDDFDFSDSETIDSESSAIKINDTASAESQVESVEKLNIKSSAEKTEELKKNPIPTGSNEECPRAETESGEDWNWNGWDDEEESKAEKKNERMEKNKPGSIWSGWETFGQKQETKQSNWGSWGVNLLLNKATAVTQGISSALESSLGAPDAQTLARMDQAARNKDMEEREDAERTMGEVEKSENSSSDTNLFSSFGITDLVAGVTSKIVENSKFQEIGSKVISGGLDTLESFGKKTMEVLQEGDPGLRSKRALLLGQNKPALSQVLKEIKEKTEKELKENEKRVMEKKCHFESLFDDFQGLVHLEALEMLSKQCELKLEQIRNSMNSEEQDDLDGVLEEVQQLCSLDDYDLTHVEDIKNFKKSLTKAVSPLKNEIFIGKILEVQENVDKWLDSTPASDLSCAMIQQKAVSTLAQLTALIVHQFHKGGEMLVVKECRKTVEEIDALSEMTHVLLMEIDKISNRFALLSKELFRGNENLDSLLQKINVVRDNSTTYARQAFDLLIPVLQVGAAV